MGRSADYTIQGFLYQFNQTLSELLQADDAAVITIEGIVEDIEVATFSGTKAIQCKYHETQEKYTLSVLYNPLLQMMKHFKSNPKAKIKYYLFAHFPDQPKIQISKVELEAALSSKNKDLQKIIAEVQGIDIPSFLTKFEITVTPKYDELAQRNCALFEKAGFTRAEIETLYYPNAIQLIADLSIKHDAKLRTISKKDFLKTLREIRSTAVTQWTLALKSRNKILETRRKQLRENLSVNARLRHIVVFPTFLEKFNDQIVLFIKSFVDKFHFKLAHTQTPLIALDMSQAEVEVIAERLVGKDVIPNLGKPVNAFSGTYFFRDPLVQKEKKEFSLRLISLAHYKGLALPAKPDDLFVIGSGTIEEIDLRDVNIEVLAVENFDELKYVLGISHGY
jgi:hypothetical protein